MVLRDRYDRHDIHIIWNRETKRNNTIKGKIKTKKTNRKGKKKKNVELFDVVVFHKNLHDCASCFTLTLLAPQSRFEDNWGQTTWNSIGLSPKRDWSYKMVKPFFPPVVIQHNQCPCRFSNRTGGVQVLWFLGIPC